MGFRKFRLPLLAKSSYELNVPLDFSKIVKIEIRMVYFDVPGIDLYESPKILDWDLFVPKPQGPLDFIDFRSHYHRMDSETYMRSVKMERDKGLCFFTYQISIRYPWSHDPVLGGNSVMIFMNSKFATFPFVSPESWIDILVRD